MIILAEKKYYWLKLKEDFFRQPRMKKLRKVAGGDTYTIIYLKMQLLSLENEGMLFFEGIEDDFIEELALTIDEDPDNVRFTVLFLIDQGLMEEVRKDEYALPEAMKSIGSETASASRMRKLREKEKTEKVSLCYGDVTDSDDDVRDCYTELELEKELEIDKEIEITTTTGDDVELSTDSFNLSTFLTSLHDAMSRHWKRTPADTDVDYALPLMKKLGNNFDMLSLAMEVASQYGERACNWNYTASIVNSWVQKGYSTEEDVLLHELGRKSDAYLKHLNR